MPDVRWKVWNMKIDRRRLLVQRLSALKMSRDVDLSPETRALWKKAADHAQVALGLDAAARRKEQTKASPPHAVH